MSKALIEQKMREMIDIASASLTKQEFLDAFAKMVEMLKNMEQKMNVRLDSKTQEAENRLSELETLYQDTIKKIEADSTSSLSNVKKWVLDGVAYFITKSQINERLGQVDAKLAEMNGYKLPDASTIALEAAKMAQEGLLPLIPIIQKVEEQLPSLGIPIRDGLEVIKEEDEKLKIDAIGYLRKELDELKKQIGQAGTMRVIGNAGSGGRISYAYDLSPSLDGVTKTFSLPSFWRVIAVFVSSAPFTLQLTTDYTVDGSAKTITFTSQIDAPTVLAVGQTCTILYSV